MSRRNAMLRWLTLLALCAPYLQGGLMKAFDFVAAVGEMDHFGLRPAGPLAVAVILLELVGSAAILSGSGRWLGALALAVFTLAASVVADPFWTLTGAGRFMATNSFFEHIALAGGLALVAWHDLAGRREDRHAQCY